MEICCIKECSRNKFCKGLCSMHYSRLQRGQPLEATARLEVPLSERFWQKVSKTEYCWEWLGTKNSKGYGQFNIPSDKKLSYKSHRWAWEQINGPIPDDLTIDHFECNNSSCVNPAHMELVTRAENTRRARARRNLYGGGTTELHTINGKTQSIKDWCEEYAVNYYTVFSRLRKGLTLEEALTRPLSRIGNGR